MIEPKILWIILTLLLLLVCVFVSGQQRADGLGLIPRTDQNAKRVQQRLTAIERIRYNMKQMGVTNVRANGMTSNNMGSRGTTKRTMMSGNMGNNGMRFNGNGMGSNRNGMGSNGNGMKGMGSNGNGMNGMGSNGNTGQSMSQGAFGYNVPSQMNNGGMMGGYIHPEQMEVMADMGSMGMMPGMVNGMTIINVEAMGSGAMGMMHGGGMGMRGRRGRGRKMKIPLCQSMMECAERFIPPLCRSWRYDTVNNIMCKKCPVNSCEGGAREYFNTMYEYHPSRLMMKMIQ